MRLSDIEFKAMNNPLRRYFQKHIEFRNFRWLGLTVKHKNILEIGCGSGYGAVLLSTLEPRSYIGIDLMPEQIALTGQWHLPGYTFRVMDAADMQEILSISKDIIVIFGILHHIPQWREVVGVVLVNSDRDRPVFCHFLNPLRLPRRNQRTYRQNFIGS